MPDSQPFTGEVHPLAARFPMLPEEELAELAADIAAQGLLQPIVLDADGVLIDGRNRLAACRLADVEPRFTTLDDHDPVAFIISANVHRRHLSKGQCAMAVAVGCLESKQTIRAIEKETGIPNSMIAQANVVMREAPELVEKVLAGGRLDEAYNYAVDRRRQREKREEWERDRERLQQQETDKLNQQIETVRLTLEAIGPEVPIPKPPNLTAQLSMEKTEAQLSQGPRKEDLDQLQAVLQQFLNIKRLLQTLRDQDIAVASFWPEAQLPAVSSAVSQIVALAYEIAERYQQTLSGTPKIRSVK